MGVRKAQIFCLAKSISAFIFLSALLLKPLLLIFSRPRALAAPAAEGDLAPEQLEDGAAKLFIRENLSVHEANAKQWIGAGSQRELMLLVQSVFIDEIDEETNLPKSEKRLSTIQTIQNGKPVGCMWTFALNGMKIYQKDPEHADAIILYVPDER